MSDNNKNKGKNKKKRKKIKNIAWTIFITLISCIVIEPDFIITLIRNCEDIVYRGSRIISEYFEEDSKSKIEYINEFKTTTESLYNDGGNTKISGMADKWNRYNCDITVEDTFYNPKNYPVNISSGKLVIESIESISYECFILGKHTARKDVASISPPRREFQKC